MIKIVYLSTHVKGIIGPKKQVLISTKAMVASPVPSRLDIPTKASNALLEGQLDAGWEVGVYPHSSQQILSYIEENK